MARDAAELKEVLQSVSTMLKPFYAQVSSPTCIAHSIPVICIFTSRDLTSPNGPISWVCWSLHCTFLSIGHAPQMTAAKRSVSLGVMEDLLSAEAQSAGHVAAWRKSKGLPMLGPAPADTCEERCCYL